MIMSKDVAIVVLQYNNADDTVECIKSLLNLDDVPGAIVVVDNKSDINEINKITKLLKYGEEIKKMGDKLTKYKINNIDIYILLLDSNDGYSKGNNLGIKSIQKIKDVKAYWILNNDTIVDRQSLNALCSRMNKETKPSIIGSTIVQMQDKKTLQCAAGYNSRLKIAFDKPILSGMNISDLININENNVNRQISYVIGTSLFIHSDVLKIGYLREDFFLYAEEMEYCIRAKKHGIHLLWEKSSIVYHKGGGTTKSSSCCYSFPKWVDYLMIRNRTRVIAEHYPILLPICWICSIAVIIKRLLLKKPIRPILLYTAIWDGTLGNMGKPRKFIVK